MPDTGPRDEVAALKRIIEITALLNSTLDLDELLQRIMSSAAELLDAETSSLLLVDGDTGDLDVVNATGASGEDVTRRRVPAHQGIAGWVADNAEPAVVDAPQDDPRFYPVMDQAIKFETRNMVAVPLRVRDETIGVVEVINKRGGGFSESDLELAQALANQAAIAVDNARLYARLADAVVTSRLSYRL
jgi:sigma-B regulation protein RsbU (phosphoserine phosphatase)